MNKTPVVVGAAFLAAAANTFALPTAVISSSGQADHRPFGVVTSANGSFTSFCLEASEFLSFGATFYYDISDAARYNNIDSLTTDPISKATAWLYRNYTSVAGYANNNTENMLVQRAIWALEGEAGGVSVGNPYYLAATSGAQAGFELVDANGAFGVRVLNLWSQDAPNNNFDSRAQDLLVYVPDNGATLALLGAGISCVALVRRRATV